MVGRIEVLALSKESASKAPLHRDSAPPLRNIESRNLPSSAQARIAAARQWVDERVASEQGEMELAVGSEGVNVTEDQPKVLSECTVLPPSPEGLSVMAKSTKCDESQSFREKAFCPALGER
jgi:hypothetical protein